MDLLGILVDFSVTRPYRLANDLRGIMWFCKLIGTFLLRFLGYFAWTPSFLSIFADS